VARRPQEVADLIGLADPGCEECVIVDLNLVIDCPEAPGCPPGLHRHQSDDLSWIQVTTEEALREPSIRASIRGKHLFFSDSLAVLLTIAHRELTQHAFHVAKMPPRKPPNRDLVLCLYSPDDARSAELSDRTKTVYRGELGLPVRYARWKSDEETREGRYSERFLRTLTPGQRERFTRKPTG